MSADRAEAAETSHSGVAAALVALAVIVPFLPALTTRTLFFRDLYVHFFPMRRFAAEAYRVGELPLWNPLVHGGMPFIADPNNLGLYPTLLLWLVLPAVEAFNVEIVLHFVIGGLLAYVLARDIGTSRTGAFVTGIVFALCGPMLSEANLLNRLCASTWMPAVILCLVRFERRRGTVWLALAAIAAALQLFAGGVETAILTWALALVWLLLTAERKRRALLIWTTAGLTAAAIAAAQILPTLDLLQQSVRGRGYTTQAMLWSVTPSHLTELFIPRFFGPTDRLPDIYWGYFEQLSGPYLVSFYFGIAALALAVFGALYGRGDRRLRTAIAALAVGAVIVSMGTYVPALPALHSLPLLRLLRYPVKALAMLPLTVGLLAGAGIDALRREQLARRLAIVCAAAGGTVGVIAIARQLLPRFADGFDGLMFHAVLAPALRAELQKSFVHAALFAILASGACLLRNEKWRIAVIAGVVFADLSVASIRTNPTTSRDLFTTAPPLASLVAKNAGGGRVYENASQAPLRIRPPFDDIAWIARYSVATLARYSATLFGLPVVFHEDFDGMATWLAMASQKRVTDTPWPARGRLLSSADVTIVVASERIDAPGFRLLTDASNPYRDIFVYRNENVSGAPRLARSVSYAPSLNTLVKRVIESTDDAVAFGRGPRRIRQGAAEIAASRVRNSAATYRIRSQDAAFLLLDTAPVRGWTAFVDGRPVPLVPANLASSGVWVPGGDHRVDVVFAPISWHVGRTITLVALLSAFMPLLAERWLRQRRAIYTQ